MNHPPHKAVYTSPDGSVELVIDSDGFDFHLTTSPDARPVVIRQMLNRALGLGYMMAEDSWPELNEDGSSTAWLIPVVPVEDLAYSRDGHKPLGAVIAVIAALMAALVAFAPHLYSLADAVSA